jgi:HK97 family phage portal protein
MEAGAFWEKVARLYWTELNVFIYIDWDLFNQNEPLKSLWIIDTENVETSIDKSTGEFYLRFYIQGKVITTGLDNIIHVARNVGNTEIFGEKNNAINTVLRVINTNNDGIENAIKTSAFLRFVINSTTSLTDKQREKKAQNFADSYLKVGGTGVAYMDASSQLTQIKSDAKYSNADEMKFFENKIYNFLHISENIIKGDFSENQWQSYYETNIETFANKLCNELNFKLFTKRQYDVGNRVKISTSDLQVVSIASKINLVDKTKEIGLYTINEFRELFNLPPVENGEERMVSLNYINSSIANEYQQSKLKNEGGKKDEK